MQYQTYNGWTNYETWLVKLWIDNSEGDAEYWRGMTDDTLNTHKGDREDATDSLRETLKEWVEEQVEELGPQGFLADMLNAAVSEVNYREIAAHWIDEVADEPESEDGLPTA